MKRYILCKFFNDYYAIFDTVRKHFVTNGTKEAMELRMSELNTIP